MFKIYVHMHEGLRAPYDRSTVTYIPSISCIAYLKLRRRVKRGQIISVSRSDFSRFNNSRTSDEIQEEKTVIILIRVSLKTNKNLKASAGKVGKASCSSHIWPSRNIKMPDIIMGWWRTNSWCRFVIDWTRPMSHLDFQALLQNEGHHSQIVDIDNSGARFKTARNVCTWHVLQSH